jgi:hypothetical protein
MDGQVKVFRKWADRAGRVSGSFEDPSTHSTYHSGKFEMLR